MGKKDKWGKLWQIIGMNFAMTQILDVHEKQQGILLLNHFKAVPILSLQGLA